ncbi:MAG: nuclear transport factor 2 family protein [Acidimicrobiales bacterium]
MKRFRTLILALTASAAATQATPAAAGSAHTSRCTASPAQCRSTERKLDFDTFLERYEAANTAFQNGDPNPWLAMTAELEPQSIFGGFGGLGEQGAEDVHQRYLLAARAFQPSGAKLDAEYLVKDVRGRLAYTVAIERSNVLFTGRTELHHQVLRVTMIFRHERGEWKIVHRHADTMIDLQLPTT